MKTSELVGAALDWAVAKCEGLLGFGYRTAGERFAIEDSDGQVEGFMPSTDWSQGGPIIERERVIVAWLSKQDLGMGPEHYCVSHIDGIYCRYGPTPLIAAMRCYVASKLGDDVDVPNELIL